MTWGEHYVFCAVCGIKVLNTAAKKDEEKKWVCKHHILKDLYDKGARKPVISPSYPRIINKPRKTPQFRDEVLQWQAIFEQWETITEYWDEK